MDKFIDARFERVEKALQTLIHSISTYNPNPAQATDLLTADADLTRGLEQCTSSRDSSKAKLTSAVSIHQCKHEKILSLRSTSSTLDNQIRETLTLLTDTRRALLDTSSTVFPQTTNPVTYSELLSYAKKISDKTLPPTYREKAELEVGNVTPTKGSEPHTNGNTTPVLIANGNGVIIDGNLGMSNNGSAMEIDSGTPSNSVVVIQGQGQTSQESNSTALPLEWQSHLNPQAQIQFLPWPADHDIKRGALATIQVLLDRGEDPATFDPERGAELEEERRLKVEEEERVQAEERARVEEERRMRERERRMSGSLNAGERREERPKVFQLETFDDDDDDEDSE